jgi:hypothetical protein
VRRSAGGVRHDLFYAEWRRRVGVGLELGENGIECRSIWQQMNDAKRDG